MGTATTMSLVGRGNVYLGGPIIPGLRVSLDALSSSAAQLFGISLEKPQRVIGKNTIECMRSGIMYGHAAMIDGMIDRMQEELGEPIASVIATGGTSQFVVPLCRHKIIYDKDLLLKGLPFSMKMSCSTQRGWNENKKSPRPMDGGFFIPPDPGQSNTCAWDGSTARRSPGTAPCR